MSETSVTYDAGPVAVSVDGPAVDLGRVAGDMEWAWYTLVGHRDAWGEMVVTFRDGKATCVKVSQTYKVD